MHTSYPADPDNDKGELMELERAVAKDTCCWILSTTEFISWGQGGRQSTDLLWICGGPGSGKTMMSIYLSKHLDDPAGQRGISPPCLARKGMVLHFFCKASETGKSSGIGILRGLLSQALRQRPDLMCDAQQIYEQHRRHTFQDWSFDMLWVALRAIILGITARDASGQTVDPVADDQGAMNFVIVDGLDECEPVSTRRLLLRLSSLSEDKHLQGRLKVMVFSRETPGLRDAFAGRCQQIDLEEPKHAKAVSADVHRYVAQQVDTMGGPDRKGYSAEICTSIKDYLSQHSLGNFLWVSMAIKELESTSRVEAWEHLSRLPSTLDAMYEWMVIQIPHGWRELSTKILLWVTLAFRPLSLAELLEALDDRHLVVTDADTLRDCISHCGQLLIVDPSDRVQLVHNSAREYLLERLESSPSFFKDCVELNPFNTEEGHRLIAGICIRNLGSAAHPGIRNYHRRKSGSATENLVKYDTSTPTVLSDYARAFWTDHMRQSNGLMLEIVHGNTQLFEESSPIRGVLAHEVSKGLLTQDVPVLHHATYHGFTPFVKHLLRNRWTNKLRARRLVRQRDSLGRTALHLAVHREDNGPIVKILLDRGANVHCKDYAGATALDYATEYGITEAVNILRAHGKKV